MAATVEIVFDASRTADSAGALSIMQVEHHRLPVPPTCVPVYVALAITAEEFNNERGSFRVLFRVPQPRFLTEKSVLTAEFRAGANIRARANYRRKLCRKRH